MIKKQITRFLSVFLLSFPITVTAQISNSITVWRGNSDSLTYFIRSVDSLTFHKNDTTLAIWQRGGGSYKVKQNQIDSITILNPQVVSTNLKDNTTLAGFLSNVTVNSNSYKTTSERNPLISHKFGADPFAMEYNGRVYVYMTNDEITYDGEGAIATNTYGNINKISCISSDDMTNWTDHGAMYIAGSEGVATWAGNSWAPTACHKTIDGKEKFFLYFANSSNGIGVVTSSTPYGPWTDPIGRALISRSTPNCSNIPWVFDPAVFIDDDGTGYLYFGGGLVDNPTEEQTRDPGSARVVKLNPDMISLASDPVTIRPPYLFEDAGINKIGDKYVYSYCTNWNCPNPGNAKIAYMTSDNPMGPFTYKGVFFNNPGEFFANSYGNNHHALFKFKEQYYLFYHTLDLQNEMGIGSKGYRSTHADYATVNADGTIQPVTGTSKGTNKKTNNLDPYKRVQAETMTWQYGVTTELASKTSTAVYLCTKNAGSWVGVANVDFQNGPEYFTAKISGNYSGGVIKICVGALSGPASAVLGYVELPKNKFWKEVTVPLLYMPVGVKTIYFVFSGEAKMDYWQFY